MGKIFEVIVGCLLGLAVGMARVQMGDLALVLGAVMLVGNCGLLSVAIYWGHNAVYGTLVGRSSACPSVPYEHASETLRDVLMLWFFMPLGAVLAIAPFIIYG